MEKYTFQLFGGQENQRRSTCNPSSAAVEGEPGMGHTAVADWVDTESDALAIAWSPGPSSIFTLEGPVPGSTAAELRWTLHAMATLLHSW
ncbi:hypothetical protein BST61_g10802 [Cercospora zeina]